MTGSLTIAGLGPGDAALVTPEVSAALAEATDVLGYAPYVARVPARDVLAAFELALGVPLQEFVKADVVEMAFPDLP